MQYKHALLLAAILAGYGTGITVFSQCRSLDRDEGYYAAAARLAAEGKMVYRDFFYPQAPALPFVYALADRAGGSLGALRLLSAAASILMLLLWSVYLASRHRHAPKVVFLTLLLLALDPHLAYWNVTVKTFALANLLLTAALVSLYFAAEGGRRAGYAVSGLCCGVLISVRLLYAPIAPIVLVWLLMRGRNTRPRPVAAVRGATAGRGFVPAAAYLAGLALGGAPFLLIFLSNPQAAIFNNLGYHTLRATSPGWLAHAGYVLRFLAVEVCDPYLVLGLALAVVGLCSKEARKQGGFVYLTAVLAALFALGTAVPYPLHAQYFTGTLAPFLVPAAALGIATIGRRGAAAVGGLMLASCLVLLWTSPLVAKARQHLWDIASVYGPAGEAAAGRGTVAGGARSEKSLASFKAISQYVKSATQPEDVVLSFWPGYVYESRRRFFPGLENDFGLAVSARLSAAERDAYKIAGQQEILAAVKTRLPKAVVIGGYWMADFYPGPEESEQRELSAALEENYALGKEIDGVKVFIRRD